MQIDDAHVERLATNADVADAPVFVLLLDDLDTSPYDSHRMIRAAEGALAAIPDTALVAVMTTSGLGGSLMTLARPGPEHVQAIRNFRGQLLLRARGPSGRPSAVSAPCGNDPRGLESLDCGDPTRAARRAAAVGAVAEILGRAGARRKALFWLTVTMGVSPLDPDGSRRAQRAALRSALNNDVAVYVLDPRENPGTDDPAESKRSGGTLRVGPGDSTFGGGAGGDLTLEVNDMVAVPLTQITRETGGRYVTMANDLDVMLARIVEQNTTSYVLTYESPVSRQPGQHRIAVRVRRPHARVYARRGYLVESPTPEAAPADTQPPQTRLLRDTLLGSVSQGALPIAVHVVPRFATGRQGSAAVTMACLLVNATGEVVRQAEVVADPGARPDRQRATAVMPTAGLAAGTYALVVEARESAGERVVRHAVPLDITTPPAPIVAGGESVVVHSVVARGPATRHAAPGTFVIRTEQEWAAFWAQLPTSQTAPEIDFTRVVLLAVVGDDDSLEPTVDSVTHGDGTTVVRWSASSAAGPADAVTPRRRPFVVVGLVEPPSATIRFERVGAPPVP